MQQTWRMGAAFREQVKHYAGLLKAQMAALGRDETSGAFDRLRHLRDVASEQSRQREPDHER